MSQAVGHWPHLFHMRSAVRADLIVPPTRTVTYGPRIFTRAVEVGFKTYVLKAFLKKI